MFLGSYLALALAGLMVTIRLSILRLSYSNMDSMMFLSDIFVLCSGAVPNNIPALRLYKCLTKNASCPKVKRILGRCERMQRSGRHEKDLSRIALYFFENGGSVLWIRKELPAMPISMAYELEDIRKL